MAGNEADGRFGIAVATAGDVNGDGNADVLVGAPRQNTTTLLDAGKVYLYPGSKGGGRSSPPPWSAAGDKAGANFGRAVGTRTSATDANGTHSYIYDQANRLTQVNSTVYQWDANGNLLSDGSSSYTYDAANRLTSVTIGNSTTTFAYDGIGNHVSQNSGGRTTPAAVAAGMSRATRFASRASFSGWPSQPRAASKTFGPNKSSNGEKPITIPPASRRTRRSPRARPMGNMAILGAVPLSYRSPQSIKMASGFAALRLRAFGLRRLRPSSVLRRPSFFHQNGTEAE